MIFLIYSVLLISPIFSQNFDRIIELMNPVRMNGQDILILQKRLLSLGFSDVGEADGYYGPLSEKVIKNIQFFSGFKSDGKIFKPVWDFIFNEENNRLLQGISIVSTYDITLFSKTRKLVVTDHEYYSSTIVYFSEEEGKAKILHNKSGGESVINDNILYYIDDAFYFIHHNVNVEGEDNNSIIIFDNNRYNTIINGILQRYTDPGYYFKSVNDEKNLLMAEYF